MKLKTRILTRLDSVLETNELFVLDSYKQADDPNICIPTHIEQELDQARRPQSSVSHVAVFGSSKSPSRLGRAVRVDAGISRKSLVRSRMDFLG